MFSSEEASAMKGNSSALEEGLHRGIGETDIEPFVNQLIRNTVVMVIHFDMVINIDLCSAPLRIWEAMGREGFEGWLIERLKEAFAGPFEFFKGAVI
jgi:hypothetical protein